MQVSEYQINLFDYDALASTTREVVQRRTKEIKDLMRRTMADILDIGLKLMEVKELVGHGNFGIWLEGEFGWSDRTAQRYMNVARAFKSDMVSDLMAPKALYVLAHPEVPDALREELSARAKAGERITEQKAKERLTAHREQFTPPPPVITIDAAPTPQTPFPAHDPETGEVLVDDVDRQLAEYRFVCDVCHERFPVPVVECRHCGHHYPPERGQCGNCHRPLAKRPDTHEDAEALALIAVDQDAVIDLTPNAFEQQLQQVGHDAAQKFENVARRAVDALTALATYSRADLAAIEDSVAGQNLMAGVRIRRLQQLCAAFLRVSEAEERTVTA